MVAVGQILRRKSWHRGDYKTGGSACFRHDCGYLSTRRHFGAEAHSLLELLAIAAADAHPCSIFEKDFVLSIFAHLQRAHSVEVYDAGSVHAAKQLRIQVSFQFRHAAADQMASCAYVQTGVVVCRLDPVDLGNLYEAKLARALDCEALESPRLICPPPDPLLGAAECEFEAGIVEGLQQLVEASGFKGAQCLLVIGGDKDDRGGQIYSQQLEHIEAIALGHLHV